MRGEEFERACADAIDRVRRATRGKADIALLTTAPADTRWKTTPDLATACRQAAKSRNVALVDVEQAFHAVGEKEPERLFVNDKVHLSQEGHRVVGAALMKAIERAGK